MEIKATLNKPYTDKQRLDFIVLNNHNKGYEIKETESALEAWGNTQKEIDDQVKQLQILNLKEQLSELDLKMIRPLASIQIGTATEEDTLILQQYEAEKEELRRQIRELMEEESD